MSTADYRYIAATLFVDGWTADEYILIKFEYGFSDAETRIVCDYLIALQRDSIVIELSEKNI